MKAVEFRIRGPKESINELITDLREHTDELTLSKMKEYHPSFFDRDLYRNSGLFEIVISVSINLVSSFVYDVIKSYVQKNKIQLIEEENNDTEEDKNDN